MNTAEKIEVMQAFEDGEKIEVNTGSGWEDHETIFWNWKNCDYRIKPKQEPEADQLIIKMFLTACSLLSSVDLTDVDWKKDKKKVMDFYTEYAEMLPFLKKKAGVK